MLSLAAQFFPEDNSYHRVGVSRIGGQIDLRPIPDLEAKAADTACFRNRGQKKEVSQREKEKARKAKATAAPPPPKALAFSLPIDAPVPLDLTNDERIAKMLTVLDSAGVPYKTERHPPAKTVEDMMQHIGHFPGGKCKNLFLKSKKKSKTVENDTGLWLVIALHDTAVNLKALTRSLGYKKALRLAREDVLKSTLGVKQGECSPLALCNDKALKVQVVLDSKMLTHDQLWFHPLSFEASTAITPKALTEYIALTGRTPRIVDFDSLK